MSSHTAKAVADAKKATLGLESAKLQVVTSTTVTTLTLALESFEVLLFESDCFGRVLCSAVARDIILVLVRSISIVTSIICYIYGTLKRRNNDNEDTISQRGHTISNSLDIP